MFTKLFEIVPVNSFLSDNKDTYGDHLRVRFFSEDSRENFKTIDCLTKSLKYLRENGSISKIVIDEYDRELERYSSILIEETEDLFYHDSIMFMELLEYISYTKETLSERHRVLIAITSINQLLDDFNLSPDEKYNIISSMYYTFYIEFGENKHLRKRLNDKYRLLQTDVLSILYKSAPFNKINDIIQKRSIKNKQTIKRMNTYNLPSGELIKKIPHYIHMSINRLFITKQREYELLIYSLIERGLYQQKNRNKHRIKK